MSALVKLCFFMHYESKTLELRVIKFFVALGESTLMLKQAYGDFLSSAQVFYLDKSFLEGQEHVKDEPLE